LVQPDANSHRLFGASAECYSQIYLDDILVYRGENGEDLFDVNSIPANQIEAIEYYASPAELPARYSGLNSPCGALVIWTRRSR
jgi:hypothetical protein